MVTLRILRETLKSVYPIEADIKGLRAQVIYGFGIAMGKLSGQLPFMRQPVSLAGCSVAR